MDKYEGSQSSEIHRDFLALREKFNGVEWFFAEKKMGLTMHLTTRISQILQEFKKIVVIEDDIRTSHANVQSLRECIDDPYFDSAMTVGLFGALPKLLSEATNINQWRFTPYYSAWGWSIKRDMWSIYAHDVVKKRGRHIIEKSKMWRQLSEIQKNRWSRRFAKVEEDPLFTWDFQMQFTSWLYGLEHALPVFRLCDNEGFGDLRATNTQSARPYWYRGVASFAPVSHSKRIRSNSLSKLLTVIDSYTWVGDRNPRDLIRKK